MAAVLLAVIYISFIGLGVPDSLFGTAWPAIYAEFGLPISFASFVTVIISCGTILSSLISARLISWLGTGRVAAFSTLLTAAALLGFSLAPGLWAMCLLAVPLGVGAGAIDVALNNYVAQHYSATHMSFLHCFYGIGVTVSPCILSLVIGGEAGWRGGYRITCLIQLAIALLLFLTLPLWGRVHGGPAQEEAAPRTLSFRETLRIPGVKHMCFLFIASCAIECVCGGWGSTFLVENRGMAPESAAQVIMLYYAGMALGRFLSGVLAAKLHSWTIIRLGELVLGGALLLLALPLPLPFCAAGMFLVGFGNGPLFPNFNYLAPQSFGSGVSQSVIGVQMASAYAGIMLMPMLCGLLGQWLGMGIFPFYMLLFFVPMLLVTLRVERLLRKKAA